VNPLRILLAVEPRLLRDALSIALEQHPRLLVSEHYSRSIDVLAEARQRRIDVVMMNVRQATETPILVKRLLAEFPQTVVIGILSGEERALIYRFDAETRLLTDVSVSGLIGAVIQD
jgi:DNA-binding NarL/FixJ family response regulator